MQDPKTGPSSFDAPMGHTLSPVDATLPRSTAAQLQTPWFLHPHDGKAMQLLHSLGNGLLKNDLGAHSAERPQIPGQEQWRRLRWPNRPRGQAVINWRVTHSRDAAMSSCTSWPTARLNQAGADCSFASA